jgi:hypothetical protein
MSTQGTWHLDDATLSRYASGETSAAVAASAEAHLTSCADCRARLAPAVDTGRLDAIWDEVEHRVEVGELPWFERLLVRVGVREDTARLLAATPSLTSSWLAAMTASVAFAVFAADTSTRGLFVFLTLAPMLPVAGVAAAYGREADPAYELAVASPYSLLRLLLVRSVAVVGSTVAVTAVGGLLLADLGWTAATWLLPALALAVTTLALSARVAPIWAATGVLTTWLAVVFLAWRVSGDRLAAFGEVGQLAALALIALAGLALLRQRNTFAFDTRRSA